MYAEMKHIRIIGTLAACCFLLAACGSENSGSSDKVSYQFNAGDVLSVGDQTINIYENPDRKSDIIDIQESGTQLHVVSTESEWARVKMNKKGLLRDKVGSYTGWIQITDARKLTTVISRSKLSGSLAMSGEQDRQQGNTQLSGREPPDNMVTDRDGLSGFKGDKSSGDSQERRSSKQDKKNIPYARMKPLEIKITEKLEISYETIINKSKIANKKVSKRFLLGLDERSKLVILKLSLTNNNDQMFPTNPLNWHMKKNYDSVQIYRCLRPYYYYPDCKFKFPGGIIHKNQTVNGGVSFIIPKDLELSNTVLVYKPHAMNYSKDFPL